MNCMQRILRMEGIRVLLGVVFAVSFSCLLLNKAIAGSNDFNKWSKPIKFDNNMGSRSLNRTPNKISTRNFDKPMTTPRIPDYPKFKEPKIPQSNNTLKADSPKFKEPDISRLNKGLKIKLPDNKLPYSNVKLHAPPENKPYTDFPKQKINTLEKRKIEPGFGKKRWWEIFKPNPF